MRLRTLLGACAATLLIAAGDAAAAAPAKTFAFLSRTGGVERQRLAEFGHCVDVLAPNWYAADPVTGAIPDRPPDADVVRMTRGAGGELWPVVNAQFGGGGRALERARVRRRVAHRIAGLARRHSYAGMTIDFEGMAPGLRAPFADLVRRADALLSRERRRLAVYVPRRTASAPNRSAAAYAWRRLAGTADLVLASGYNEHYSGSEPGPITTSTGFAAMLSYASGISRTRIAPTIGAFGYRWPHTGGRGQLISATEAESDPFAAVTGVEHDGEVNYSTPEGVVWSETASGLTGRAQMAADAGFRWLGLFSLGREPRAFWATCG